MLENIKSSYFLKLILEHIITKKLFKLIKYNKSLQNAIDINLIDYKSFSRRFIIYEKKNKNKGVEILLINKAVLYEGEYSHGERNGKGKEYDMYTGYLIYEGEFLQ